MTDTDIAAVHRDALATTRQFVAGIGAEPVGLADAL